MDPGQTPDDGPEFMQGAPLAACLCIERKIYPSDMRAHLGFLPFESILSGSMVLPGAS